MVIFGGASSTKMYSDTWIFSLNSLSWREVKCDKKPKNRRSHTATLVDDEMVICFGIEKTLGIAKVNFLNNFLLKTLIFSIEVIFGNLI
jgi:hypothetical protein